MEAFSSGIYITFYRLVTKQLTDWWTDWLTFFLSLASLCFSSNISVVNLGAESSFYLDIKKAIIQYTCTGELPTPHPFFDLRFAFTIIHGSGRAAECKPQNKNRGGLGKRLLVNHCMWTLKMWTTKFVLIYNMPSENYIFSKVPNKCDLLWENNTLLC